MREEPGGSVCQTAERWVTAEDACRSIPSLSGLSDAIESFDLIAGQATTTHTSISTAVWELYA